MPALPPDQKALVIEWLCDCLNEKKRLFSSPLVLDTDAIANYEPPVPLAEPDAPQPESAKDSAPRRGPRTREFIDRVDETVRRDAETALRLVRGQAVQ